MSDAAAEPGVPTGGTPNVGSASEKSIANEVKQRVPAQAVSIARTPDRFILRMNKLLASPGGLSAFLSTFNYTLYLLAYLDAKSAPLQARLYSLLARLTGRVEPKFVAYAETDSRFRALGALLAQTRVTLRLFGLFPMYAWFRQLIQGPKPGQDLVLYGAQLVQCSLYMAFQFFENLGILTDNKVLPEAYTARWTASRDGKTTKLFLTAYRCWFAGVLTDLVRLGREWQLRGTDQEVQSNESKEEKDAKWWTEAVVPFCWAPVAAQFCTEGGVSWFNLGIMGAGGGLAGLARTASLWRATEE